MPQVTTIFDPGFHMTLGSQLSSDEGQQATSDRDLDRSTVTGRRLRVGLWGNFGCGNIGNDATLGAAIDLIRTRLRDAELVCICTAPDVVAARFGIRSLPIYAQRAPSDGAFDKAFNRIRDAANAGSAVAAVDYMLVPGTGPLCDFGERPVGFPLAMLQMAVRARARGVPVNFVAVGAGPIVHPMSRRILATATRLATHRSFRDSASQHLMATLGVDTTRDAIVPDLVFSTDTRSTMEMTAAHFRGGMRPSRTIGLGVMAYFGHDNDAARGVHIYQTYIEKMIALVRHLLQRGDTVRLLIGEQTDLRAVEAIANALSGDGNARDRLVIPKLITFSDLLSEIAKTDIVVGSRFHNVIGGLIMRRPTLSLSYSHRHDLLMSALDVGEWRASIETFTVDGIAEQIDALDRRSADFSAKAGPHLDAYKAALNAHADEVVEKILVHAARRRAKA